MIPILVVYFNRPKHLEVLLLSLKTFKPKVIYFSCDGAREGNLVDPINIEKCNAIIERLVDWSCEKKFLKSDQNKGCDEWVPESISWFFSQETKGIILEDDCIIDVNYYLFASELLDKYSEDEEIMNISAMSLKKDVCRNYFDYYFSCYPLTWGWATWKRAWGNYQSTVSQKTYRDEVVGWLISRGFSNEEIEYWDKFFSRLESGQVKFWDAKWIYSIWLKKAYSITPNVNLVKNIGYGDDATHMKWKEEINDMETGKIFLPLSHPSSTFIESNNDRKTFIYKYKFTIKKKILYLIKIMFRML